MCHLMSNDSFDLSRIHLIQESCRDCNKGAILGCSSSKSIGFCRFIVSNFRNTDIVFPRDSFDGVPDNLKFRILVCGINIQKNNTICTFCHPARYGKRDKGSCKTKYYSVYCYRSYTSSRIEDTRKKHIDHKHDDRYKCKYCYICKQKEEDSFDILHNKLSKRIPLLYSSKIKINTFFV